MRKQPSSHKSVRSLPAHEISLTLNFLSSRMASTTTTLTNSLGDYHIQLTGAAVEGALPIRRTERRVEGRNPANWPTNYRRVPPHRPVNRNLDLTERPNGASTGEWIFVNVMLNGVRLNSVSSSSTSECRSIQRSIRKCLTQSIVTSYLQQAMRAHSEGSTRA